MKLTEIQSLRSVITRFLSKVDIKSKEECWEWTAGKLKCGNGQFRIDEKKRMLAHKFSYLLFYGETDDELCTCHICDNRGCINPFHLFEGTQKDNINDMMVKGRRGDVGRPAKFSASADFISHLDQITNQKGVDFVNRTELCKILDISLDTSFRWQRLGMPKKRVFYKGLRFRWEFDLEKVKTWLEKRKDANNE